MIRGEYMSATKVLKYAVIKEDIIEKIKIGELNPGDKIESESVLKKKYNVSAITVRKAFSDLITEGYLYAVQGLGTFVAKKQMIRGLTSISFSDELVQQGYDVDMKVISVEEVIDSQISKHLDLEAKQSVVRVERIRIADGAPIAHQVSYISSELLSLEQVQRIYEVKSFYKVLADYDLLPTMANETYSVKQMPMNISSHLEVDSGDSSFYVERFAMSETNEIIEYGQTYFNKDWYSVTVNIKF